MANHVTKSISSGHPLYAFSSLQDFIADFSELQKLMSSGEIESSCFVFWCFVIFMFFIVRSCKLLGQEKIEVDERSLRRAHFVEWKR